MRLLKTITLLAIAFSLSYCAGGKNNAAKMEDASQVPEDAEMIEKGYSKGTIRYSSAEGDCPWVIEIESEDYNYMLDPINLEESFKEDGAVVWFKFAGLRRPNRCEKANPINIIEILRSR